MYSHTKTHTLVACIDFTMGMLKPILVPGTGYTFVRRVEFHTKIHTGTMSKQISSKAQLLWLYLYFTNEVGLVHKKHIIRTRLMYHAACKVELQPFKRLYSQLTFFNFFMKWELKSWWSTDDTNPCVEFHTKIYTGKINKYAARPSCFDYVLQIRTEIVIKHWWNKSLRRISEPTFFDPSRRGKKILITSRHKNEGAYRSCEGGRMLALWPRIRGTKGSELEK